MWLKTTDLGSFWPQKVPSSQLLIQNSSLGSSWAQKDMFRELQCSEKAMSGALEVMKSHLGASGLRNTHCMSFGGSEKSMARDFGLKSSD